MTCDCRHEREGRCALMPKVRVTFQEWQDSGHPMLSDTLVTATRWEHPPADEPCGQQAPREAVPEPVIAMPSCLAGGCARTWSVPHPKRKGQGWCEKHAPQPTPPAAAPAPSEAAREWRDNFESAIMSSDKGEMRARGTKLADEAVALIAAAERRAEAAESTIAYAQATLGATEEVAVDWAGKHLEKRQEVIRLMSERDDLRAKLAAAEKALEGVQASRDYLDREQGSILMRLNAAKQDQRLAEQERDHARDRLAKLLAAANRFCGDSSHIEWNLFRDARRAAAGIDISIVDKASEGTGGEDVGTAD